MKRCASAIAIFIASAAIFFLLACCPVANAASDDPSQAEQLGQKFSTEAFQTNLYTLTSTAEIPVAAPTATGGGAPKINL